MAAAASSSLTAHLTFRPRLPISLKPSSSSSSSSSVRRPSSPLLASAHRCRLHSKHRKIFIFRTKATDQQGPVQEEIVDGKILPYCSLDKKAEKKSIGEMEQEFLQALQSFYFNQEAIMSNEEFDNLKEELMWEGSSVVMLSPEEQKFLEASMAYVSGKPIMTDAEFDQLKLILKQEGSSIVQGGPRCSLRSRKVYSDLNVDYFKMLLLNVPAAVIALTFLLRNHFHCSIFLLYSVMEDLLAEYRSADGKEGMRLKLQRYVQVEAEDDLTGFEITYLLELPEPYSFIFTWFAALPLIFWLAQSLTNAIVRDFLILKGPCPNCGTENVSFFGTILSVPSGGAQNTVKCSNCATAMLFDSGARLITLPEPSEA